MRNQSQLHSKHALYFEAIIQLRPYDPELHKLVRKWVYEKNSFISQEKKLKTGLDIYVSSYKVAKIIGQRLKNTFKGELKKSYALFGRDKNSSRDLYRTTVLFRKA